MNNNDIYKQVGYDLVISQIPENSKVLDLGCGDGELLSRLIQKKRIQGFGVEISESGLRQCVEKGLYCYQSDIDEGLSDYKDNAFNYVILNQTIQSTKMPEYVLKETMRVAEFAIVSFPNFAHYTTRLSLLLGGLMPKTKVLPFEWYNSPNIHLLTIRDFVNTCKKFNFHIKKSINFSYTSNGKIKIINSFPNIFAQYGFFILDGTK